MRADVKPNHCGGSVAPGPAARLAIELQGNAATRHEHRNPLIVVVVIRRIRSTPWRRRSGFVGVSAVGLPKQLDESRGACSGVDHAAGGRDFVCVGRDHGLRLDQISYRKCSLFRPIDERVAVLITERFARKNRFTTVPMSLVTPVSPVR
jgi:hypothetical protein